MKKYLILLLILVISLYTCVYLGSSDPNKYLNLTLITLIHVSFFITYTLKKEVE